MVVLQSRSTRRMKLQYCTVHLVCFWVLTLSIFFCCTRQLNSLGLSSYDSCGLLWVVFSFCGQIFAFSCVNDFQRFPRDLHYTWQIGNIHFNSKKKKNNDPFLSEAIIMLIHDLFQLHRLHFVNVTAIANILTLKFKDISWSTFVGRKYWPLGKKKLGIYRNIPDLFKFSTTTSA